MPQEALDLFIVPNEVNVVTTPANGATDREAEVSVAGGGKKYSRKVCVKAQGAQPQSNKL